MKKKSRSNSNPPVDQEALELEAGFIKGWLDDIFTRQGGSAADEAKPHPKSNVIPFPKPKKGT